MSDHELKNFVLVGSFRDNEASDNALTKWMSAISTQETIVIGDLNDDCTQDLLSNLLKMNKVEELAQLAQAKASGNAFHATQLVGCVESEGLLPYSLQQLQWTWSIEKLKEKNFLSDNVAGTASARLNRLGLRRWHASSSAAAWVFDFDPQMAQTVKGVMSDDTTGVDACLKAAIDEGALEQLSETRAKLGRDCAHHVALLLEPSSEK